MSQSRTTHSRPRHIKDFDRDQWADKHGVHPEFLPFEWGPIDPITVLCEIPDIIEDQPDTAKMISRNRIDDVIDTNLIGVTAKIEPLIEVHGGWKVELNGQSRFINPNYQHMDTLKSEHIISDAEDRIEILERLARYGVPELKNAAPRFGIQKTSVKRFARRHDVQWQTRRREGLARMARTWVTLHNWGYDFRTIGQAFGYEPASIPATINRKVSDDFSPPSDPTIRPANRSQRPTRVRNPFN